MRLSRGDYPCKVTTLDGRPAVHVRDPKHSMEFLVQISDEPVKGQFQIQTLVVRPDPGVEFPRTLPAAMLAEVAAEALGKRSTCPRWGNRYGGPPVEQLAQMVEEGLSRAEMAERLGRPLGTLDGYLKRARRLDPNFPRSLTKNGHRRKVYVKTSRI